MEEQNELTRNRTISLKLFYYGPFLQFILYLLFFYLLLLVVILIAAVRSHMDFTEPKFVDQNQYH